MAGFILVLSVLLLGAVIATIGDRLGTRVGKARLSLMGMRPRKTAVAITILTGGVIAATTLGILFATNSELRTGVFELDSIQRKLRQARRDLEATQAERRRIEQERDQARQEQITAEKRLASTRSSLEESVLRQRETQERLGEVAQRAVTLRNEAQRLQREQQVLTRQRDEVARQIAQRDRDLARQESQLEQQTQAIAQQEREIAERDARIEAQRAVVAAGESRLQELENTQAFLDTAIREREQGLQLLRQGNVALTRREVLATRVVRVLVPEATQQAINLLLQEANRNALEALRPGTDEEQQIIQITQAQVERLGLEIQDGQEYVVRILSAGNYIQGESRVLVFSDVVPNEIIFKAGEVLATTSVTLNGSDLEQLQDRIGLVIEASRFRARQAGIVSERTIIGDDRIGTLVRFYEQLQTFEGTLTLQAITSTPAYTAGPLRINLSASRNGLELLRTEEEES